MTTERETTMMNDYKPVWPDFIAPPKYDDPDPRWVDPDLPDFRLIWKVARECGYAVGLHGSMKRDCDMIAAPWTDEAVIAFELIERLCAALNARVVGPIAGKPHGRLGWNLQVDGYVKVIDISVMPRSQDRAMPALERIGTGLYETQPTPDPAAIREAALREALKALDSLPEYGSPDVNIGVSNAYSAILALIPKGAAEPTEYERKVAQMKKDFPNGI